jgi:hypothetical protein
LSWFSDGERERREETCGVERTEHGVTLRLPLQATDDRTCAWIHLSYSLREPLSVDVSICSPSGASVVERIVLRRDMRTALFEPVLLPRFSMGPSGVASMIALVFQEESLAVPVTVPAPVYAEFLRACDKLVPMNERAEAMALTNALHSALERWS